MPGKAGKVVPDGLAEAPMRRLFRQVFPLGGAGRAEGDSAAG